MRRVLIESPYRGDVESPDDLARVVARNRRYLDRCIRDCLMRNESPIASHKTLVDVCPDDVPEERERGIRAGFAWRGVADATVIYTDHGISHGMKLGIEDAQREQDRRYRAFESAHHVEYRQIGAEPEDAA